MLGCKKDSGIEPGEVKATVIGYVIADYWGKGCSTGGLEIKVGSDHYFIANAISSDYNEPNSWPISVWIRYESAPPDSCGHWTNRVNILSIRKQ